MVAWGQFEEDELARLQADPDLADQIVGPEPVLDLPQKWLLDHYLELRRQTHSEVGIPIDPSTDPIVARHLRAMDRQFHTSRAENMKAMAERRAASARAASHTRH